jgi:hypothetical protein
MSPLELFVVYLCIFTVFLGGIVAEACVRRTQRRHPCGTH